MRGVEMVMDLLGVVAGDRDIAEQAAEQPGAGLGDLVEGKARFRQLGEDRQHAGAGRRFENDVAGGQRCGLGGGKAERDRRRELLEVLGFLGAAGLRREPPSEAGQHLEHRRGRARARAHRAAEFAQEQDLGRFEGFVGVLPHPRPFGIRAAERSFHRRTQGAAVERAALPEQLREQRRGMKKPCYLVERSLRQKQCQSAAKRDPGSASNRDPYQWLSSGRPRSPRRGPARVAQCPHERRSGARGEALWAPRVDPAGHGLFRSGFLKRQDWNLPVSRIVAVVREAVEQRRGHLRVGEDAWPFP